MQNPQISGITLYLEWLEQYLKCTTTMSLTDFNAIIEQVPPPDLVEIDKSDPLGKIFNDYHLSLESQFIFVLSISPLYIQGFLNSFFLQSNFTGSIMPPNGQFVPTVEIALDLLSLSDKEKRTEYLKLFLPNSELISNSLIHLIELSNRVLISKRPIIPNEVYVERMIAGKESKINFSYDFPAVLMETANSLDDLVVDHDTKEQLKEIGEWIQFENEVIKNEIEIKGFREGYKSLFYGPPGTGKTMAASIIGKMTGKPVYRIDLSAMVSKYIGETEKNLRKVFDKADHGRWILFFDEADALFGKRGQTNNSNDRYANMEVAYLLQRFESYHGVAILASNYKDNIDVAFNRRFDSIINFKSPEFDERKLLWEKHLPESFKFDETVDLDIISQNVKLTGAQIHNIMRRCFMKSVLRKERTITGKDMLDSVQIEYQKENKIFK